MTTGGPDEDPGDGGWDDPFGEEQDEEHALYGHWFPSLVWIEDGALTLSADGLDLTREEYEGDVKLTLTGTVTHPFDGKVAEVEVRASMIPIAKTDEIWHLFTAPPLELTDEDLATPIPHPEFTFYVNALDEDVVLFPGASADLHRDYEYREMMLLPRELPGYLALVSTYELTDPSPSDVARILTAGGTPDLIALRDWSRQHEPGQSPFSPEDRMYLMELVGARLRSLRAPPGLGDLQRLYTTLELVRLLAHPEDLEFLLGLDRAMQILQTSSVLSYHDAVSRDTIIELPVEGMYALPSAREFTRSYQSALTHIRRASLPRLLELSYDPIDFRDAPRDAGLVRSPVRRQAVSLLEPLTPTSVTGLLDAAGGDLGAQREILEFYVRVRHAPAVEPMLHWLEQHPEQIESVGLPAAEKLGTAVVPALLQQYIHPGSPEDRDLARRMLLELRPEDAHAAIESLRSTGIAVADDATLLDALEAYEAVEARDTQLRATELERELFEGADDVLSLGARVRAAASLFEIAPERLEARSEEIVDFLSHAALALDSDSPTESRRAMSLLEEHPLPGSAQALALARARIAVGNREFDTALTTLLEHDPELIGDPVRELYAATQARWIQGATDHGQFGLAAKMLEDAIARLPDDDRFAPLERELFLARYWPALVLACLFALVVLATAAWLAFRSIRRGLASWRNVRREMERLRRREDHARRTADELADLASIEHELDEEDEELDEEDEELESHASISSLDDLLPASTYPEPRPEPEPAANDDLGGAETVALDAS